MRFENRHILLLLDNFAGHHVNYQPSNIRLEFFEPNLTAHVQPLDAGIIQCFKACYRHLFCMHALAADEAREANIWKINIKDCLEMATEAWNEVSAATIANCWSHAGILPTKHGVAEPEGEGKTENDLRTPEGPAEKAWAAIFNFLGNNESLLQAEAHLASILGTEFTDNAVWPKVLALANDVEDDDDKRNKARQLLEALQAEHTHTSAPIIDPETAIIVTDLQKQISELQSRNHIFDALDIDEFIKPKAEHDASKSRKTMPTDDHIVASIQLKNSDRAKDVSEASDCDTEEEEEDVPEAEPVKLGELLELCTRLATGCCEHGVGGLALQRQLLQIKADVHRQQTERMIQTGIKDFFWETSRERRSDGRIYPMTRRSRLQLHPHRHFPDVSVYEYCS